MRTTLTIDDDIFEELNQRSMLENKTFKDTVNNALRLGLGMVAPPAPAQPFKVLPFQGGLLPGIDPLRLNQLAGEMEMDSYLGGAMHKAKAG